MHLGLTPVGDELIPVVAQVNAFGCKLVEVTGGEPLAQQEAFKLIERLSNEGYEVLVETGGYVSTAGLDPRAKVILDIKCPASGEADRMDWENLGRLRPRDEVKFVINDRADYEYARDAIARHALAGRAAAIHMSPVHGVLNPRTLSEWVLADQLPVRVQLQLHKYIWPADMRGV